MTFCRRFGDCWLLLLSSSFVLFTIVACRSVQYFEKIQHIFMQQIAHVHTVHINFVRCRKFMDLSVGKYRYFLLKSCKALSTYHVNYILPRIFVVYSLMISALNKRLLNGKLRVDFDWFSKRIFTAWFAVKMATHNAAAVMRTNNSFSWFDFVGLPIAQFLLKMNCHCRNFSHIFSFFWSLSSISFCGHVCHIILILWLTLFFLPASP